jgi:hypothetical protein
VKAGRAIAIDEITLSEILDPAAGRRCFRHPV